MFFYGVIVCVGGVGSIGYLAMTSQLMCVEWGATTANIMVGILSTIVDNIPVMFSVLTIEPEMSMGQWLLVTLTAGVGGSMLYRLDRWRGIDGARRVACTPFSATRSGRL